MTSSEKPPIALEERDIRDGRLVSPSAGRNRSHIAGVLAERLPHGAQVLEIGSGTGEHALAVCEARADVFWQPSDPDAASRASQSAWAQECPGRIADPLNLDLTQPAWFKPLGAVDALVCINVIHIAPWSVAEGLAAGARALLKPGGLVYLYGPYQLGESTAPSNLDFDRSLRQRNPDWGVRDLTAVETLLARNGFALEAQIDMPANNLSLVFRERSA